MRTQNKVYSFNPADEQKELKQEFILEFWDNLYDRLRKDKEFCRVQFLSEKYQTNSTDCLLDSLRSSMDFKFIRRPNKKTYEVILNVKTVKIKDLLSNCLDGNIYAKCRRNPNKPEEQFVMLNQLINGADSFGFSFLFDSGSRTISVLKPLGGLLTNPKLKLGIIINKVLKGYKA
jgi:hypothetical protein